MGPINDLRVSPWGLTCWLRPSPSRCLQWRYVSVTTCDLRSDGTLIGVCDQLIQETMCFSFDYTVCMCNLPNKFLVITFAKQVLSNHVMNAQLIQEPCVYVIYQTSS